MSGFRIVFVVRRFWPDWDGASRTIGAVAAAVVEQGGQSTVVTMRQRPQWPPRLRWRGVAVVRLPWDRTSRWAEWRWTRNLSHWMRDHAKEYELACVSGLRRDAYAVLGSVETNVPVVLRAESTGRQGDCLWHLDARFGRRIKRRTMRAAALVATSPAAHRELIAAGYPRKKIQYMAHGAAPQPARDAATRSAARKSLAANHPELSLLDDTPLAVFVGQLRTEPGLSSLVTAWNRVVASRPRARLWLVGDGPLRAELQQRIDARGLGGRVVLVGRFDEVDTLLAAADLFVLPSPEGDLPVALLEAMAAGLPAVVCDNRDNRETIEDQRQGLLVPPGDPDALAAALGRLIDEPKLAERLGTAARQSVQERFSLARMVQGHVTLFENLLDGTP